MEAKEVIIIGGGVAGISASVAALEKGWKPVLLERTGRLGGRVRSLYAKDAGSVIDNGQHVLSASYTETRRLLSTIGSLDKIDFQKRLSVDFRFHRGRNFYFRSWPLPAPLHFLLPLLLGSPLSKSERKFLYRWAWTSRQSSVDELKRMTVPQWLELAGEAPFLEQLLWEPLTLAALNTPLKQASAFLLHQVLEKAFLGTSKNSGLGIPRAMLSDIFADPAEKYIRANGGEIRTFNTIKRLVVKDDKISEIETAKREIIKTPQLILAIPPHALARLMADSPAIAERFPDDFSRFQHAPIITVNLWFKKLLPGQFPLALVDSPIQWIFKLPETAGEEGKHGYTVVISAAVEIVEKSQAEILQIVEREFRHFFGGSIFEELQLLSSKTVKEKFATILQTPESLKWRPSPRTNISNLFLAGDWINTGLPATIESAVLSGKMAVAEVERETGKV
jgi:squalene-associated FAD-dependent desaturase